MLNGLTSPSWTGQCWAEWLCRPAQPEDRWTLPAGVGRRRGLVQRSCTLHSVVPLSQRCSAPCLSVVGGRLVVWMICVKCQSWCPVYGSRCPVYRFSYESRCPVHQFRCPVYRSRCPVNWSWYCIWAPDLPHLVYGSVGYLSSVEISGTSRHPSQARPQSWVLGGIHNKWITRTYNHWIGIRMCVMCGLDCACVWLVDSLRTHVYALLRDIYNVDVHVTPTYYNVHVYIHCL